MAKFVKIVFFLSTAILCMQVNAQGSRLTTLAQACLEATGGHEIKEKQQKNHVEIVMPSDMNYYKFVSVMASVMRDVIPQDYIGVQPWKVYSDIGIMQSIHRIINDLNNLLLMSYVRSTNTLILDEGSNVDLTKMLHSSNYPTLSNMNVYIPIYLTVTYTNGFIIEDEIDESAIYTTIQTQKDSNIQIVKDQLKGLHDLLLMVSPRYEQVIPWQSTTNCQGAINSRVWTTSYLLTYSSWEKSSIKRIDFIYEENSHKIGVVMYEKLPDK